MAHMIKGSALNLSATTVAGISGELEVLGLQLRLDGADPMIEKLEESVRRFHEVFQEEMAMREVAG